MLDVMVLVSVLVSVRVSEDNDSPGPIAHLQVRVRREHRRRPSRSARRERDLHDVWREPTPDVSLALPKCRRTEHSKRAG
eukprot:3393684-Rhodomonas_salina.2